ncbi:MAG: hypothetical protein LBD06_00730, partial [Candidatus Accumulibacter sp.]|nr:hypothetical protein [Accumulibacter sp.]
GRYAPGEKRKTGRGVICLLSSPYFCPLEPIHCLPTPIARSSVLTPAQSAANLPVFCLLHICLLHISVLCFPDAA